MTGLSFDGVNTPWSANGTPEKLLLTSGQFTSTIKTSLDVSLVDATPTGLGHGDFDARSVAVPGTASNSIAFTNVATADATHTASNSVAFTNTSTAEVIRNVSNSVAFTNVAVSNIKSGSASNSIAFANVATSKIKIKMFRIFIYKC